MTEKLNPILERMMAEAAERTDESFAPPTQEAWYELHDSMTAEAGQQPDQQGRRRDHCAGIPTSRLWPLDPVVDVQH
jgi:hypothetical protein